MESPEGPNTVRIGGEAGASLTAVSAPLVLDTPITHLARLPEQRRAIVNLISTTAQQTLTKWDQFTFQLPQTEFVQNHSSGHSLEPLVSIADLCIEPDEASELAEIAVDPETGEPRRITTEQSNDIIQYGRFSFPSRQFPHVNHVWQLPWWMVRGRKKTKGDFNDRIGYALDHLLVYFPNRIYQKSLWADSFFSPSIVNGLYRVTLHMKGIVAAMIGLSETAPRQTEYKHRNAAEKQYLEEKCSTPDELLDLSYYFDTSLYEPWYSVRARDERDSAYDETYRLAALETFQYVSPDDLSTSERTMRIHDQWRIEEREEEIQLVCQTVLDERKRLVVVERVRAHHIIQDGDDKLAARIEREKLRFIDEAKREHPILSLSHEWLEKCLWEKGAQHYNEWQRSQEDENIALMRASNLHCAAKFEEGKLQFEREVWPDIRASWLRDRIPARAFDHAYYIFNPRRWREGGESGVRLVRTTTARAGWRIVLLWRDTVSFLRAGLYFTAVTNLWRGPVGLQALFSYDDVPYAWDVDPSGTSHASKFHMSLYTRLRAIWRRVRELHMAFEEDDDTVFGKDAVRWLHYIINHGFRGAGSTAIVIVAQPLLTVVNVAVTTVVTATAVVWAPLSALVTYCTSWLVYDWRSFEMFSIDYSNNYMRTSVEHSPRWFPVASHLGLSLLGVLEACISCVGLVVHPIYAIFRPAWACVQRGARMVWDSMWHGLLRRFGRWPRRDSFLAQRVSGVGVSGSYYFRLSTELVTQCVRARLEQIELNEARKTIEKMAKQPVKELEMFTEDVLSGLCESAGRWGNTMVMLKREESSRLKRIDSEFEKRERMLHRLTNVGYEKDRIRPEKGVATEQVLQKCVEIVERFYEERIAKLGEVSTNLWVKAGAAPGDIKTLARYLLDDLFSEEFLRDVEESEETLEIPVTFDDVINVYATERSRNRE